MIRTLSHTAMLLASIVALPAAAQPSSCVTTTEAQSLALVAMPDIIRGLGLTCADRLPPTALIRQTRSAFLSKYEAAADAAWPKARGAIAKVVDPSVAPLLQSDYARPMVTALLIPQLIGQVDPVACPVIERLATWLAPLPPENTAGIIVASIQLAAADKAKGGVLTRDLPALPLCPVRR